MPSYCNGKGGPAIPAVLNGRSLVQRCAHMSAPELACLAADWAQGKIIVPELTVKMIVAIVGTNTAYFYAALRLSDAERDAVHKGLRPLIPARTKARPAAQAELDLSYSNDNVEGAVDHVA